MDPKLQESLAAFHVSANKTSLHILDERRLFDFIQLAASSPELTDELIQQTFEFLTRTPNNPWSEDLARKLMRDIRFGIELLRYHNHA